MRSDRELKLWVGWLHLVEGGTEKVPILRAALTGGLCTSLVSDLETARAFLP
jgi:DNA-binding transcriptional regulator LsrR (DeoR family)